MSFEPGQGLQTILIMIAFNAVATGLKKGVDYLRAQNSGETTGQLTKGFFLSLLSGTLEAISANTTNPIAPKPPQPPAQDQKK